MSKIHTFVQKILPESLLKKLLPFYHYSLAFLGALVYRFPSRKLTVIGITGTKGKTSVAEITNTLFEEAGYKTAVAGTLRFKIGDKTYPNLFKMTMPGRFFLQRFLRRAINAGCTHAILEMTSEGAKQYRHKFIDLDLLIFTNLTPEHIESHGSYEKYRDAKLSIAAEVGRTQKIHTAIVANADDREGETFLNAGNTHNRIPYNIGDASPYELKKNGSLFTFQGITINLHLPGVFNIYNALAASFAARFFNINLETIKRGIERVTIIRGRMERIQEGQNFEVYVDYAHTPESLKAAYETLDGEKIICVFGSTGGGRDRWKRKVMGEIADSHCSRIILTNEDPYDEDPDVIVSDIHAGIKKTQTEIIMDRREAIKHALTIAKNENGVVMVTGKGTDPYIMLPNGKKQKWDDATVVREELQKV